MELHEQYDFDHRRGANGIGYELTTKQLTATGVTDSYHGRDQAKMDRAKTGPFPNVHPFEKRTFPIRKAIGTLYEEITNQFTFWELKHFESKQPAGLMREINVHDKAGKLEDINSRD